MNTTTANATVDNRKPLRVLVEELHAFGAKPGRKFPIPGSEWESVEWDMLAELACGAH